MAVLDYSVSVTTGPTAEPVSVHEAKQQVGVAASVTGHDSYLRDLITAARERLENDTRRVFVTQTLQLNMSEFPASKIEITKGPLASVTSIQYRDSGGVLTTWSSSNYEVDTGRKPGVIWPAYGVEWPTIRSQWDAVQVVYVAGEAVADVPSLAKHAILLSVSTAFENREFDKDERRTYDGIAERLGFGSYP